MAAVPRTASTANETEFDYEGVREKYMRQIEMYYFNRKLGVVAPWTRKLVDRLKTTIKEGFRLTEIGYPPKLPKYRIMNKYEIYRENGEEKLIYKRKNAGDRIIQVIGAEDCFDIIVDAHITTEHGGFEKVMKILRLKYSVPKTSIDFILALCNVCMSSNNTEFKRRADNRIPQVFHSRGQVSLIEMTSEPDQRFKYILFYLDRFTKYMLLRPLLTNSVNEVAMELLKIFLDFGPPEKLETYDRVYFGKVLGLISSAYGRFNISLMIPVKLPEIGASDVKNMLKKWQIESGSKNWAMGCYVVQWERNCTLSSHFKSPYSSVFKMKPWHSLPTADDTYKESDPKNVTCSQSNDYRVNDGYKDDELVISDSEDDKVSTTSEVAEISEENGDIIATIPLKHKEIALVDVVSTANRKNEAQPLKIVTANSTPSQAIQPALTRITSIDDIPVSMIMKPPEIPGNSKCHVCKTHIAKPYNCLKCNRSVHLFCSDRLMKQDVPLDVLDVTCTACTIATQLTQQNVVKQKLKETDISNNFLLDNGEPSGKRKKIE